MRFPGGCYVEGDWMRNAFRWKDSVGPNEERPGHMNGGWGHRALLCCCGLLRQLLWARCCRRPRPLARALAGMA